jgi:hypothetical protein
LKENNRCCAFGHGRGFAVWLPKKSPIMPRYNGDLEIKLSWPNMCVMGYQVALSPVAIAPGDRRRSLGWLPRIEHNTKITMK